MKPIEREFMLEFKYPSQLLNRNDKILVILTKADVENNDYLQSLHQIDPLTKEDVCLIKEQKRIGLIQLKDGILVSQKSESGLIETRYGWLQDDGSIREAYCFPLAVSDIKDIDEDHLLLSAGIHLDCADYFRLKEEEKKAWHKSVKDDEDYLHLTEYPFFYNGAGFINKNRTNLFVYDKNTKEITRIGNPTCNSSQPVICADTVYFLGNDYEHMRTMFADIYAYNFKTGELKTVYKNKDAFLGRLFELNGKIYITAAFDTCISGRNFYELTENGLQEVCKTEWMMHNSIATDARYGRNASMLKKDGKAFFLTTDNERSILVSFDGRELKAESDNKGAITDMVFIKDQLYLLSMQNTRLEEIYSFPQWEQISRFNTSLFEDRYVAEPERITCFHVDEIAGFVLKPINFDPNKKYPMILDIHGGPKSAYGDVYYHEMQMWCSLGYFVIYCNPHCSDGKGNAFADYLKHYGATDYGDIMAFVDKALELYPQIDKERLGVTGGSYGGYMTNWIITQTDRFKAAVSQRSISNRVADFYYSDYSFDTTYENGIPLDDKAIALFWDRSPLKYVSNAKTPILFIQSTEDYRCPFPEAVQLFAALTWKGVKTEIFGFKGENHELSRSGKPVHRLRRLQEITRWFEENL